MTNASDHHPPVSPDGEAYRFETFTTSIDVAIGQGRAALNELAELKHCHPGHRAGQVLSDTSEDCA